MKQIYSSRRIGWRIVKKSRLLVILFISVSILFSCGQKQSQTGQSEIKNLNGAGATFPYPLYSHWADKYASLTGIRINYQSIGSGAGIAQIKARTVDFGATDAPLTPEQLHDAELVQFPLVIGGVVPVVNLEEIQPGELRLSGNILADIYLGKINVWNDPRIQELNPDLNLPDREITPVHRADGSGTTWIFTNYLGKVSPRWKNQVGVAKAVAWPAGPGGKGNEGVTGYAQRIKGAIGYTEYAYALQNNMAFVALENQSGNFVTPGIDNFLEAFNFADSTEAPSLVKILTDLPGTETWPITGMSFILLPRHPEHPEKVRALLEFFDWCYQHGQPQARQLEYLPVPERYVQRIENLWRQELTANGQPLWHE